jgi:glucose/arabinose dehydrogenase
MHHSATLRSLLLATVCAVALPLSAATAQTLTGADAFTTWEEAAPGVRYHITPADLPEPMESESVSNPPGVIGMPEGAEPAVPEGFDVQLVASGLEGPRVVRTAPNGDLFIANSDVGEIRILKLSENMDGQAETTLFAEGLNQPYGIAFYPPGDNPQWIYVANTDSVVRFPYQSGDTEATGEPETIVSSLPTGGHWTRDIAFSPDGSQLFVSVGSQSNIADEISGDPEEGIEAFAASHPLGEMWDNEEKRATVLAFEPETLNQEPANENVYATGLRNCSGMTIQPATDALWCVVNERDELGDNLVPDYATTVAEGKFYGWPWYYIGDNEDPREPLAGQRPDLAGQVTVPDVLIQAHSAPLNIVFYDGEMFPAEYQGDAFVALHGSWNRGARTGYKVVRMLTDDSGKPTGEYEDFMTGFVESAGDVWGRPVGVAVADDGSLIVTEDGNGSIWRVTYEAAPS